MGKYIIAKFEDQSERIVADFSNGRADLFYEVTTLLEKFLQTPSGMAPDNGSNEYYLSATQFPEFFEVFWQSGWLSDIESSFVIGWAEHAAGILMNISLNSAKWIDRNGRTLKIKRSPLHNSNLENLLK
ncbi:MAG: hypothetical protein AAF490_25360 [Chloroflexota bacterium]